MIKFKLKTVTNVNDLYDLASLKYQESDNIKNIHGRPLDPYGSIPERENSEESSSSNDSVDNYEFLSKGDHKYETRHDKYTHKNSKGYPIQ